MRPLDALGARGRALAAPRWRGQPGRLEVWYATATDEATGTGVWVHHEIVAPDDGAPAYGHGWLAAFPPDAPPVVERFGARPVHPVRPGDAWLQVDGTRAAAGAMTGHAGTASWDWSWANTAPPLLTFPQWAWDAELLPAAQVVPAPRATVTGPVTVGGLRLDLHASGGVAHIYGHGNAERWGWLHADLGDGDLLEIVSAVSRRRWLSSLPPLAFVQLRVAGRDWPRDPLLAGAMFRTRLGLPQWTVTGVVGDRRLHVRVTQPPQRCVAVDYTDPDGATAVCTNTERADVEVVLQRWRRRWRVEREWTLTGTAHAEVGLRGVTPDVAVHV